MGEDSEQLRHDIEATRTDLARDLDALAFKASPSRIAHDRMVQARGVAQTGVDRAKGLSRVGVEQARVQVRQTRAEPRRAIKPAAVMGAVLAALVTLRRIRRRR